jgi:acyl carrier protein
VSGPPREPRAAVLAVVTDRPLPPHSLTVREAAHLASLPGRRRQDWLVSRNALRLLLRLLGLSGETTRYAFPHRRLSLTHTQRASAAAGVMGPVPCALAGVGVDLEPMRTADPRTARFFLDERERAWLDSLPPRARAGEHMRLWTVKEALFKSDPANDRTTLLDYVTAVPAARSGRAGRRDGSGPRFAYASGRLGAACLTVAASFHRATTTTRSAIPVPAVTFEQVAERVSETLRTPVEKLTPATTLAELVADSFLLVEMSVDLQEEFDTAFSQEELRQITTLGELVDLLASQQPQGS